MEGFLKLIAYIWQQYGMGAVQIVVIFGLFGKLFNNHLKHIQASIEENIKETKEVKQEILDLKERVSYIEGAHNISRKKARTKKVSNKR